MFQLERQPRLFKAPIARIILFCFLKNKVPKKKIKNKKKKLFCYLFWEEELVSPIVAVVSRGSSDRMPLNSCNKKQSLGQQERKATIL